MSCGYWYTVVLPRSAVDGLQWVIVVFPGHIHLSFHKSVKFQVNTPYIFCVMLWTE